MSDEVKAVTPPVKEMPGPESSGHDVYTYAKLAWQQTNMVLETQNAAKNYEILNRLKGEGQVKCLSDCPPGKGPCVVVGSGSSLHIALDTIKDWKGGIVCSTSHGSTLVKAGAPPTHMIAVDPRTAGGDMVTQDELGVAPGGWDETAYCAHVSGPFEYFDRWSRITKAPIYVFRILEPNYPWYTKHLPAIYPWVRVSMLPFIDSLASAIQLAGRLGYDPIYLLGCDYGGPRFNMWQHFQGEWKYTDSSKEVSREFLGPGGLPTGAQLMYSMRGSLIAGFMQMMNARRKTRIYQCSKPSNVAEFPYRDWKDVLANQGWSPEWTKDERRDVATKIETRLAASDTYLIPAAGGLGVDYRVYLMHPTNFLRGITDLNREILGNKYDMAAKEAEYKMTIQEMIAKGLASLEHGDMMLYGSEEMKDWSWKNMRGLDIEAVYQRCMSLKMASQAQAEAEKAAGLLKALPQ